MSINRLHHESAPVSRSAFMSRVYTIMAGGVATTATVAYAAGSSPAAMSALSSPTVLVPVLIAPFVINLCIGARRAKSPVVSGLLYLATTSIMGLWLAGLAAKALADATFAASLGLSVGTGAVMFMGLAAFGWTTKKDLSGWGTFLLAALLGLIVAGVANIFLASAGFSLVTAAIGVLVFSGLIAYDVQRAKHTCEPGSEVSVALSLYLDFVNLVLSLLQLFGRGEQE